MKDETVVDCCSICGCVVRVDKQSTPALPTCGSCWSGIKLAWQWYED